MAAAGRYYKSPTLRTNRPPARQPIAMQRAPCPPLGLLHSSHPIFSHLLSYEKHFPNANSLRRPNTSPYDLARLLTHNARESQKGCMSLIP